MATRTARLRCGAWDNGYFCLHDGRTINLMQAIQAHAGPGSEANFVEPMFDSLNLSQQQDPLNFLRSL